MKKHTAIITAGAVAALGLSGALIGVTEAGSAPQPATAISAPMRTQLLPGVPVPVSAGALEAFAAALSRSALTAAPTSTTVSAEPVTTFAVTQPPPVAAPGPQPSSPGVIVQVAQCVVTWTYTETNPDPLTQASPVNPDPAPAQPVTITVPDSYDGDCTTAAQVAAQHPGSTVLQVILPVTTSPGELPSA